MVKNFSVDYVGSYINWANTLFSILGKLPTLNLPSLNVPSHFHILWLNFDKANHSFLHPFLLDPWGNRFSKKCTWGFAWWTGAWVKMHRFKGFSKVSTINWKIFLTNGRIWKSEKIQQAFWWEIKHYRV